MAGNLIGEPFEDYVNEQIKRRQKIQGKSERTLDEIQYLSNRNAWIKLASGVSISSSRMDLLKKNGNALITDANITTGQDLAQNYVLFNGLTEFSPNFIGVDQEITEFNQQQRAGVRGLANNPNPAYGVGGTDFGYSPMPGITDMEFRCLNRGSIKKATLNIKAHNRDQFDIIDVLYLRLGYSVFIEWGYDKYIDNDGKLQQMDETLIDGEFWREKYKNTDYSLWLPKIETKREETDGNYDGAFGTVSNFSWDFASDGTYNIKVEIISLGDVIESLRVDLPTVFPSGVSQLISSRFNTLLQESPNEDQGEKKFYSVLYPGLEDVIENWYNNGINGNGGTPPEINIGKGATGWIGDIENPTSSPTAEIFQDFTYENPLGKIDPLFDISDSDIKDAIEFSLVHSVISNGGDDPTYQENFPGLAREIYPLESNPQNYGYFGTKWLVEDFNFNGNSYPSSLKFSGVKTNYEKVRIGTSVTGKELFNSQFIIEGGTTYWNSITLLKSSNPSTITQHFEDTYNSRGSKTGIQNVIYSLIPYPKEINPPQTLPRNTGNIIDNEGIKFRRNNALNTITTSTSSLDNSYQYEIGTSFSRLNKAEYINISSLPYDSNPNLRDIWQKAYDSVRTTNPQSAWNYLLNTVIDGVRFSPDLAWIKTGVYNYFRLQGKANATPITELEREQTRDKAANEGEITPEIQERERLIAANNKDLQNKNKNRIYRFFYDIRNNNSDDKKDPFIEQTLGINFKYNEDRVSLFNGVIFGDNIRAPFGDAKGPVIIRLSAMANLIDQNFIRLDYFLYFLVNQVIPKIEETRNPLITIDGIDFESDKTICYVIDNVISLDIRKLIIRNDSFIKGIDNSGNPIKSPLFPDGLEPFVQNSKSENLIWGRIMNVYFNFTRLEEIFDSKNTKDAVSLFEALKTICEDINDALGGINNIEPVVNENNIIKFIDQTPIPGLESIAKELEIENYNIEPEKEAVLEVFGYNNKNNTSNFVTNIGLSTQIDKNYATAITIGATANGGVPGMEATAFSKWNVGITDRFKNNLVDGASGGNNVAFIDSVEYKGSKVTYAEFLNQSFSLIGLNDSDDTGKHTLGENYIKFNKKAASSWYKIMQIANSIEENGATESSIGFLPFNLKIDMDGISGIKIYNRVQVNTAFLPSNYPETLEFIITQVNHKLSANGWSTSLETIATAKNQKI
jgi:hypothetical protein